MLPTINIGRAVLPTGPLILILGMWVALTVVERAARRLGIDHVSTYGIASTGLIAGLIGARLTFVFFHWSAYADNLISIIWPLNTGYELSGGIVIGILAAFFYGRAHNADWPRVLDALAPGVVIGLIAVSASDFLAGPGYGETTNLPWGISQFGIRRHPVQLYQIMVGILALGLWYRLQTRRPAPGQLFLGLVATVSVGFLFTDAFRATAWLTDEGYHVVQIISLATSLGALVLMAQRAPT